MDYATYHIADFADFCENLFCIALLTSKQRGNTWEQNVGLDTVLDTLLVTIARFKQHLGN